MSLSWSAGTLRAADAPGAVLSLDLVNRERVSRGLAPLQPDSILMESVRAHAEDMAARGYYGHVSPEGADPFDRFLRAGGSRSREVSENIGYCRDCTDSEAELIRRFHTEWMASPGHRDNILDPQARRFGFAMALAASGLRYAVQDFAGPGSPRPRESGADPAEVAPEAQQPYALSLINARRAARSVAQLDGDAALSAVARQLLSQHLVSDTESLETLSVQALRSLLPEQEKDRWRKLGVMVMACGGCGDTPSDADIEYFMDRWAEGGEPRMSLLDRRFGSAGFALLADGLGRKIAMLVLAADR